MTVESRLAAYNYVKYVYATGTGLGTLQDAVRDRNWPVLVDQGQRQTRLKTDSYTFTAEDIAAACRVASSWSILATADGLFFGRLNDNDDNVGPILRLCPDGSVASYPSLTLVDGAPAAISDSGDAAASVATISTDQPWTISVTNDSSLAFRRGGSLQLLIQADGNTWSAGNNGYFAQASPGGLDAGGELRTVWPPYANQAAYAGWRLAITSAGYFVFSKDGDAKLALRPDGAIWNKGAGGWVRTRSAEVPAFPSFGPAQAALLATAGAISIAGHAYNVAGGWTVAAATDVGSWFEGAAGSVADGFNVGTDWAASTVTEGGKVLVDTAKTVVEGITQTFDPTGW